MFIFIADDDDMTDLAEAIMEDCDGEVSDKFLATLEAWLYKLLFCLIMPLNEYFHYGSIF